MSNGLCSRDLASEDAGVGAAGVWSSSRAPEVTVEDGKCSLLASGLRPPLPDVVAVAAGVAATDGGTPDLLGMGLEAEGRPATVG